MWTAIIWLVWVTLHCGTTQQSKEYSKVQIATANLVKAGCYLAVAILLTIWVNR